MIVVIDIGNTYIKYKSWIDSEVYRSGRIAHDQIGSLPEVLGFLTPDKVIVSNVSSAEIEQAISRLFPTVKPVCVASQGYCLGVTNAYDAPEKLGVDRWLALIEAFHHSGQRDCLVFDLGTALTLDVVDAKGSHRGGYIVPGLEMMRGVLLKETRGVRFESSYSGLALGYGLNTRDAVEHGTSSLVLAWIRSEISIFRAVFPDGVVYVTGGLAPELQPFIADEVIYHHDLVLDAMKRIATE